MAVKSNLVNMALCLTAVCLVCAAVLGVTYAVTCEPIAAAAAAEAQASIAKVLPAGGEISPRRQAIRILNSRNSPPGSLLLIG